MNVFESASTGKLIITSIGNDVGQVTVNKEYEYIMANNSISITNDNGMIYYLNSGNYQILYNKKKLKEILTKLLSCIDIDQSDIVSIGKLTRKSAIMNILKTMKTDASDIEKMEEIENILDLL